MLLYFEHHVNRRRHSKAFAHDAQRLVNGRQVAFRELHVDRGARVKAGELLAEIDAPELDQQVLRADAALDQGRAALVQLRVPIARNSPFRRARAP